MFCSARSILLSFLCRDKVGFLRVFKHFFKKYCQFFPIFPLFQKPNPNCFANVWLLLLEYFVDFCLCVQRCEHFLFGRVESGRCGLFTLLVRRGSDAKVDSWIGGEFFWALLNNRLFYFFLPESFSTKSFTQFIKSTEQAWLPSTTLLPFYLLIWQSKHWIGSLQRRTSKSQQKECRNRSRERW